MDNLTPLAERVRPDSLERFVGQAHLFGENGIVSRIVGAKGAFSMILWGDPGTGKTTLARLIARACEIDAYFLSAISSGVGDVRAVIEKGVKNRESGTQTLLFLDEIHRFNKAQQDAVLGAVETGDIVLIGATTENPSFQVIPPLLSRCRVLRLNPLEGGELREILDNALRDDEILRNAVRIAPDAVDLLIALARGDARRMLNILETAYMLSKNGAVDAGNLKSAAASVTLSYDRMGDRHYDTISAFIKSLRGSDPDAAVYYLSRMILAGEDPEFIARRMVIFSSEDVGNASPQALSIAVAALVAVQNIGMPEAEIILSHCATFLASCPKSNASYLALQRGKEAAQRGDSPIPMHLRNAPTGLMKRMGYARDYQYPHDFPGHFVDEEYLPEGIDEVFYRPSNEGSERAIRERLMKLWPKKYGGKGEE